LQIGLLNLAIYWLIGEFCVVQCIFALNLEFVRDFFVFLSKMGRRSYVRQHLKRSFKRSLSPKEVENLPQNEVVGLTREEEILLSQVEVADNESKISEERARDIYPYEFFSVGFTRTEWYVSILIYIH
jgi:hypothetical protein